MKRQAPATAVTVVGTGTIGSAVARTLLEAGHTVSVWNRTSGRTKELGERGATCVSVLADAVSASPLVLVFVVDYAAARNVLSEATTRAALRSRSLIVFTTGSPLEARDMADWAQEHGVDYLDGVIGCYPRQLGTSSASAYYAGPGDVFARHEHLLACLGGEVDYLGEAVGSPAVLEQTELMFFYAAVLSFLQMVAMGEPEGLSPADMLRHLKRRLPVSEEVLETLVPRILGRRYDLPESSIDVDVHAAQGLVEECRRLGLDTQLPELVLSRLRAAAPQFGNCDIAALIELVRPSAPAAPEGGADGPMR